MRSLDVERNGSSCFLKMKLTGGTMPNGTMLHWQVYRLDYVGGGLSSFEFILSQHDQINTMIKQRSFPDQLAWNYVSDLGPVGLHALVVMLENLAGHCYLFRFKSTKICNTFVWRFYFSFHETLARVQESELK